MLSEKYCLKAFNMEQISGGAENKTGKAAREAPRLF